jgi:arylsulfatase
MYVDGWKANAQHTFPWRQDYAPGNWDEDRWELYHLPSDFSEAVDLAEEHPEKLTELKQQFDEAAERYHVYPLDDRGAARLAIPKPLPPGTDPDAKTFTYYPGATRIAETAAPPMKNRSWTLTAIIHGGGEDTEGVVMGFGGLAAGISLYLDRGVPTFDYNYFDEHTVLRGGEALPAGKATLVVDFAYEGSGSGGAATITLRVNGEEVDQGRLDATVPGRFGIDTFGIGEDTGQPVTPEYQAPFKFTGSIEVVTIEVE